MTPELHRFAIAATALVMFGAACRSGGKAQPEPSASVAAKRAPIEAPDTLGFPPELRKHFGEMANAEAFGGLAVGAAAMPSPATEGFRAVLLSPRAAEAFAFAAEQGSVAGQLYGLAGLALVDKARYDALLPSFESRSDTVTLWTSGCTGGHPAFVSTIVRSPDAARADGPSDTIASWQSRNSGADFKADIAGGFYPIMLAGKAHPAANN